MAIYLNGGQNPQTVTYNGSSLTRVYFYNGSTTQVWGDGGGGGSLPSTLPQINFTISTGVTAYVRDSVLVSTEGVYYPSTKTLIVYGNYSCDISLELKWPRYELVGAAYSTPFMWWPSTGEGSISVSGMPSGCAFDRLTKTDQVNLDFLQTQENTYDIGHATIRTNADCNLSMISMGSGQARTIVDVHASQGYHALYTPSTGVITQGAAVLKIREA